MKSITPREQMEHCIQVLEAVKTFHNDSDLDLTLEQALNMTIKILEAHLGQPTLELVKMDDE